jgi:hypothetical protein
MTAASPEVEHDPAQGEPSDGQAPARFAAALGLPRPRATWTPTEGGTLIETGQPPQSLPAPWVQGDKVADNDWMSFRDDLDARVALERRLCTVCGLAVEGSIVYLRYETTKPLALTSGPGAHAVCAVLAARHCPHLVRQRAEDPDAVIAYVYDGPGQAFDVTEEDLAAFLGIFSDIVELTGPVTPVSLPELTARARAERSAAESA